jgi:hypothetical protein
MNMIAGIEPRASPARPARPLFEWAPAAGRTREADQRRMAPDPPRPKADKDGVASRETQDLAPLDRAEQAAILLSQSDGRRSLGGHRASAWLGRLVSGAPRSTRLGGDRLEALRRYAILYRLEGARLSPDEDRSLLRHGYSARQTVSIRFMVDSMDAPSPRRRGSAGGLILLASVAAAIYLLDAWLARQVDDPLSALVVTIALVTGLVSMVAVSAHPKAR